MNLKMRWVYVVFILALFPVTTAHSQLASLSKVASNKRNVGLGYLASQYGTQGMSVLAEHQLGDTIKISSPAEIWFDDYDLYIYESLQIVHVSPLGSTGLDFFLIGGLSVNYTYNYNTTTVSRYSEYRSTRYDYLSGGLNAIGIIGGGGLSKTLGRLKPFVGVFYNRSLWTTQDSYAYSAYQPIVGCEFRIIQRLSIRGKADWWYQAEFGLSDPLFLIELDWQI